MDYIFIFIAIILGALTAEIVFRIILFPFIIMEKREQERINRNAKYIIKHVSI